MKEFIKKNLKYLITVAIIAAVIIGSIIGVRFYSPNKTISVNDNVTEAIKNCGANGMLTITGELEQKGITYEWYYAKNTIISANTTDLHITEVTENTDIILENLNAEYLFGYKFNKNANLNGYPMLTINLPDCDKTDLAIYCLKDNYLIKLTNPAVNTLDSGHGITYAAQETEGTFYIVGGFRSEMLSVLELPQQETPEYGDVDEKTAAILAAQVQKSGSVPVSELTASELKESSVSNNDVKTQEDYTYVEDTVPDKTGTSVKAVGRKLSDGKGTGKDKYLTDPVPEGKPVPVEPEDVTIDHSKTHNCYLTVECSMLLNNMDTLRENAPEKESFVPADGMIYTQKQVLFYEGESVYDVLVREMQKENIQIQYEYTAIYHSVYVQGIHNLYEFNGGELSGWMYKVNGWFPNYGCSRYLLQEGDNIVWTYTCDLGKDVGCDWDVSQE